MTEAPALTARRPPRSGLASPDALGSLWANAMDGDLPAVAAIRRIIEARYRLYGLTGHAPKPQPSVGRTVVMAPDE